MCLIREAWKSAELGELQEQDWETMLEALDNLCHAQNSPDATEFIPFHLCFNFKQKHR